MALNLGSAVMTLGADTSGLARGLNEAEGLVGRMTHAVTGSFQRIGEIAAGVMIGNVIPNVVSGVTNMAEAALDAYASYERLGMSLESMIAREIRQASAVKETIVTGTARVQLTEKETKKLKDQTLQRDLLAAKLKEEEERHRQLVAKWGEEGLAVKTHAAQMAQMRAKYDETAASIGALTAKQGQLVKTTETNTRYTKDLGQATDEAKSQAADLLNWTEQLAIKSPFTTEGVAQALRMGLAYGFNVEQAKRLTQAMIDFTAGSGGSTEQMQRISLALGQIQARGKLAGQEVLQLTEAGLPVTQILADAFGVTTAQLSKLQEQGLIPADKAIRAITEYLETNFAGAAERQATSWAGLRSTFQDIKQIALRDLFTGIFKAIQPLAAQITDLFGSADVRARIKAFGDEIGRTLGGFITKAQALSGYLQRGELLQAIRTAFGPAAVVPLGTFVLGVKGVLAELQQAFTGGGWAAVGVKLQEQIGRLWGGLTTWWTTNGQRLVTETLGRVGDWLNGVARAIAVQAPAWAGQIGQEAGRLWGGLTTWWTTNGQRLVTETLGKVGAWLNGVAQRIGAQIPGWIETLKGVIGQLWSAFTKWWETGGAQLTLDVIGKIVSWIGTVVSTLIAQIPTISQTLLTGIGALWKVFATWWDTGGQQLVLDTIGKIASWIGNLITTAAAQLPGWVALLGTMVGDLWHTFATWWETGGAQLTLDTLVKIGLWITDIVKGFKTQIAVWKLALGAAILKWFNDSVTQFGVNLPILSANLGAWLGRVVAGAIDVLAKLPENIAKLQGQLGAIILAGIVKLAESLPKLKEQFVAKIKELFDGNGGLFQKLGENKDPWAERWKQAFIDMWNAFIASLLKNSEQARKLADWYEDVLGKAREKVKWAEALIKQGKEIVAGLGKGITDNIPLAVKEAGDLATKIGKALSDLPGEMWKIGVNAITSLADAIWSQATTYLREKAQGIASQLPEWVKQLLGIASPSTVFRGIGFNVMAGFGLGLADGLQPVLDRVTAYMRMVVDTFARLAGELNPTAVQSAKAVTDPIAATFQNLVTVVDALNKIGNYVEIAGLAARLTEIIAAIKEIINQLQDLAGWAAGRGSTPESNLAYSAKAVTDPIAAVAENLSRTLGVLGEIAAYDVTVTVDKIREIIGQLRLLITEFDVFAGEAELYERLAGAVGLASALSYLSTALQSLPGMLTALQALATTPIGALAGQMTALLAALTEIVIQLTAWSAQPALAGLTPKVALLVQEIAAIGTGLQTAVQFLADLSVWQAVAGLDQKFQQFVWFWQGALANLDSLRRATSDYATTALATFAAAVGQIATGLAGAIGLLDTLAAWRPVADINSRSAALAAGLRGLIEALQTALGDLRLSGSTALLGQALEAFVTGLRNALDLLAGLAAYVGPTESQLRSFTSGVLALVERIGDWAATRLTLAAQASLQAFGDATGALFAALRDGLTLLADLVGYVAPTGNQLDAFLSGIEGIIARLDTFIGAQITPATLAAAAAFGEATGALFDGLSGALEVLAGLAAYVAPAGAQVGAFLGAVEQLVLDVGVALTRLTPAALAAADEFGAMLGGLFDGLGKALAVIQAASRVSATVLADTGPLATLLGRMFAILHDYALTPYQQTLLAGLANFGATIGALFGGLKTALDVLAGVASADLTGAQRVLNLLGIIDVALAALLKYGLEQLTPEAMAAAANFGTAVGALFNGLRTALDALAAVASSPLPTDTRLGEALMLLAYAVAVAGDIALRMETPALRAAAAEFGASVGALFGGLKAGLEVLATLPTLALASTAQVADFTAALSGLLQQITELITAQFAPHVIASVAAFGAATGALFGGLKAGLEVLGGLARLPHVTSAQITAFLDGVTAVVTQIAAYAMTTLTPAAAAAASAFGATTGAVFGGLKTGLDVFYGLQTFVVPLNTRLRAFLDAVTFAYGLIQAYATGPGIQAGAAATTAFAQATGAVFGGLKTGLDVFKALNELDPATELSMADFQRRMAGLIERVGGVMRAWRAYVETSMSEAWLPAANEFSDAVSKVLGVIQTALNLFGELTTATMPSTEEIQAFIGKIVEVFTAFQGQMAGATAQALGGLAAVADPTLSALFGAPTLTLTTERRIIVEFTGTAGGDVPLTATQFDQLKRDLAYAISIGA